MRLPESMSKRLEFLKIVWKEFGEDNGSIVAAAVSFFDFLSLFPLLLVGIAILAIFIGSTAKAESLLTQSLGSFTAGPGMNSLIRNTIHGRGAATGIGAILLLWSGTTAVVILEEALNIAFDIREKRPFFKRRGLALLILIIAGILVLASLGFTGVVNTAVAGPAKFFSEMPFFAEVIGYIIGIIFSVALFFAIYKLLPYTQIPFKVALVGGLFAGILFEIAKQVFTFYVINFASYDKVYGSIGGVILLMVWINYTAIITILGAEFASVWGRKRGLLVRDEE